MLTEAQNDRVTRVGPGTPCGEMMRRYWHPVAAVSQMRDVYTMNIRLLAEDLVLFKTRQGEYGLIDPYCPHRRMSFIYGVPTDRGIRCAYHGWEFEASGKCLEMPYESSEDPNTKFPDKVTAKTYTVQQMAGILFAYLGPAPAPLLPRWDVYTMEGMVRDIGMSVLPCNWLQCQENSLDPVHVEWLHQEFANYVLERQGKPELKRQTTPHVKIGFDVTEYGIVKRRVIQGGSEEDEDWKLGHPIVFPNILRQGGSGVPGTEPMRGFGGPAFQIRTPIDDEQTAHWWVASYPKEFGQEDQKPEDIPFYSPPVPVMDKNGQPEWDILDSNSAQDPAAWVTQGVIADRSKEHLGLSDKGIILYRRMLEDNIKKVEMGLDPMNTFRDPEKNVYLFMHTETAPRRMTSIRTRQGAATKHSPILTARGVPGPGQATPGGKTYGY